MKNEMTDRSSAAEVFHPGEFIKEELETRGWTNADLAEIMGRHPNQISLIIRGDQDITPETAKQLSAAFGTSAQLWLNLQSTFNLSKSETNNDVVARRAKLYDLYPVREIVKRGWIEPSDDIDVLEKRFNEFYGFGKSKLAWAARKSTLGELNAAQTAWLRRAYQLARGVSAQTFSDISFRNCLEILKVFRANAEDVRRVPRVLADHGIRLLIIEALTKTAIDGVCFWLDRKSPVIVLSLRYDRIDSFWFTLMHELCHVKNKDGLEDPVTVDTLMFGKDAQPFESKTQQEKEADTFASQFLVDQERLLKFIARVRPYYYKSKITNFANLIQVHPGLVVGQLQHRKVIDWSHNREMLPKVRDLATQSTLTDGWGSIPRL
jgi:HTH-type transcriptional regulator / antitoxin HigA